MSNEIKRFTGMGFDITRLEPDEYADFPCNCYKLGEEISPIPCPEESFVFISINRMDEGMSLCRKHFTRFAFDMMEVLDVFGVEETDLPPEEEDGMVVKDGQAITRRAFYEIFMRVKHEKFGEN